jgi:signal transduction histidine kinase
VTQRRATPETTTTATATPLAAALEQFAEAADALNLEPDLREILRFPQRETTVRFPVQMDDGSVQVFTGYRVWHNITRGPAKGGVDVRAEGPGAPPAGVLAAGYRTLLASLAHDLKNPLTRIHARAQLLRYPDRGPQRRGGSG